MVFFLLTWSLLGSYWESSLCISVPVLSVGSFCFLNSLPFRIRLCYSVYLSSVSVLSAHCLRCVFQSFCFLLQVIYLGLIFLCFFWQVACRGLISSASTRHVFSLQIQCRSDSRMNVIVSCTWWYFKFGHVHDRFHRQNSTETYCRQKLRRRGTKNKPHRPLIPMSSLITIVKHPDFRPHHRPRGRLQIGFRCRRFFGAPVPKQM